MDIWTPEEGERLDLIWEPDNIKDKYAVSVMKDDLVVGHVPYNLAPRISQFLKRDINFAEVKYKPINRGAGFGLEISCVYYLYGPKIYIDKMKEIVDALSSDGLL